MKHTAVVTLIALSLVVSCRPEMSTTPQPAKPPTIPFGGVQLGGEKKNPETTRPLAPNDKEYCWNTTGTVRGPTEPPTPFLYQPFEGTLSEETWTSQMDHDQPNYRQNGKIATLGELLRYDAYKTLLDQGEFILAYQSPSLEKPLYYDGHDGHDFAVWGKALAAADGKVVFKGDYGNGLGRVIEIYHAQGYLTRYAHLASFEEKIGEGGDIKVGQPIGNIGGSAVVGGKLQDNYWGVHLHFSVFRWSGDRGAWQITDPFGWDPWAGPDIQHRQQKQREDPLVQCNGEVSYDLWVGDWPSSYGKASAGKSLRPTKGRYVGGWLGEQVKALTKVIVTPRTSWTQNRASDNLAVRPDGTIYLTDASGGRVLHYNASGKIFEKWEWWTDDENKNHGAIYYHVYPTPGGKSFNTKATWVIQGMSPYGLGDMHCSPIGIAFSLNGQFYVLTEEGYIFVFNANGEYRSMWGGPGNSQGQFAMPTDMTVAPDSTVYVADGGNHRVQHLNASGKFLEMWGAEGTNPQQFKSLDGIAVAPDGTVYVADALLGIQHFAADGKFLKRWWSISESEQGQFVSTGDVGDVAVGPNGTVYVADKGRSQIKYFTAAGNYIGAWGGLGKTPGQFDIPAGIAVAPNGTVYVYDANNNNIQYFTADGKLLGIIK